MISGATFAFESMKTLFPLTLAVFLPIQSSIVLPPRVTVAFLEVPSQSTVPPSDSMIARMGTRVLPFLIMGGESKDWGTPLTVNLVLPTWRMIRD